ncbi:uncharacterized protein DSM5745_03955 [Aspergillus mulundensis]|uniref:Zn(2)-C6 fungal-type domain-containing protein n=1 Tax=Aspergillus mulundensis TaxID=1810919 RepID=A0A3D8SB94_9EURO|nr:Uncharacterized protein DSM5745_03955 [Aspergillus mulundensis]RDW83629.1 Uncharacterized protein DSM5745_03955 [Aspergillus mulundensis]
MSPTKTKTRRITQACDFCHRRGVKCRPKPSESGITAPEGTSCLTCEEYGQECTRKRQPKKRGTKPRGESKTIAPPEQDIARTSLDQSLREPSIQLSRSPLLNGIAGKPPSALANRRTITELLDVYLDSIHPNFPLFCERELWVGWRDGTFPRNDSDFMSLTSLCALSAQHVRDGALFSDNIKPTEWKNLREAYVAEAVRLVPVDLENSDLNLVRSYTFLALLGAQTGNHAMLHKYLSLCHGVSAQLNLDDESRWSPTITTCEQEVRRRLWWSIYRLEVHTACVLGNFVRTSESRCGVGYPIGAHHPAFIPGRTGKYEDWFNGWNTTTDLYRVLEHAISELRAKHRQSHSILGPSDSNPVAIMARLSEIQQRLLPQFVTPASRSGDNGRNRCGFQAPNIICTIHLARLLACVFDDDGPALACGVAGDLLASITAIPLEYIRAAGSPLIQQLAGVAHILVGLAKKRPLTGLQLSQIEDVVHSVICLLSVLAGQSPIAFTTRDRLTKLLSDLQEVVAPPRPDYEVLNTSTTPGDIQTLFNMNVHPDFANELLTDFTWLYPQHS